MAKFEGPENPPFAPVTKPQAVPRRSACSTKKWACAVSTLLLLMGLLACLVPLAPKNAGTGRNDQMGFEDPLNDLLKVFMQQGIEPADQRCLACFFSDAGRVRRAPGTTEAFLVYKSDDSVNLFQVVTHMFNPQADFALTAPFSFWTAGDDDKDGQPDEWQPLSTEYQKEGSVMGWERGIFFSGFPTKSFLKISFNDMEGSWRPQLGNVLLVPQSEEGESVAGPQVGGSEVAPGTEQPTVPFVSHEGIETLLAMAMREFIGAQLEEAEQPEAVDAADFDAPDANVEAVEKDDTIVDAPCGEEIDAEPQEDNADVAQAVTEGGDQAPALQAVGQGPAEYVNPLFNQNAQ